MKIYEIGTGYTPIPAQISAATEIIVEELTKAFIKMEVPVEIIDIAADTRSETELPIRQVKVPGLFTRTDLSLGILHKLKRVAYSVALAGELKRILKAAKEPVVLHFHNQYNMFFFLKLVPQGLRKKCKAVYTNHNGLWRLPWQEVENTIQRRYFQEKESMMCADLVFVLNEETKQNLVEHLGISKDRIVLINNGVNTEVYHPLSEVEKQTAKEKWGLQGKQIVLQVGSVYENKGQLRSLAKLESAMKRNSDLIYAYVGGVVDEGYQNQIAMKADELGLKDQVRYLGMVSPGAELNQLYNIAEATIFASKYEGFSLVLIESLAAGVPILIDENSPFDLGDGCVKNEADLVHVSREMVRDNAVNNYSWGKIAGVYFDAFERA